MGPRSLPWKMILELFTSFNHPGVDDKLIAVQRKDQDTVDKINMSYYGSVCHVK